jgi:RNA polymerase sigma factor (sigma-70 family)
VVALVRRASDGDESAWTALVGRFAGMVWAIARGHGLCDADAADVSQTTWLRLTEHLSSIREPERLGAWLATTARRESLRMLRSRERLVLVDDCAERLAHLTASPRSDDMTVAEPDAALWTAFEALPEKCRALLRALLTDPPLSYAELSETFGMPIGSIGPTRARCLDRLRELIALRSIYPPACRVVVEDANRRVL